MSAISGNMGERQVLVAMSGGIDSSVSALLIQSAGFSSAGVTLKLHDSGCEGRNEQGDTAAKHTDASRACCDNRAAEDTEDDKAAEDASRVCAELGIPHYVFDFSEEFESKVIDRFCDGYLQGQTPNPCIDCNRFVKFEALEQCRDKMGFDYAATGHYARCCYDDASGKYLLKRALDRAKDQSYVLFRLTQDKLSRMRFPLGELTKTRVRELARKHGFSNAEKPESQDICFIPHGDYAGFIARYRKAEFTPGEIVDRDGKVLGTHSGLARYTVGQRKGLGIAASEPLYVYEKHPGTNTLVVGTDKQTLVSRILVRDVNLIAADALEQPLKATVKTHYRQEARQATVTQSADDELVITFDRAQRACAPGQAAVIYDGDIVIGGGTIDRSLDTLPNREKSRR